MPTLVPFASIFLIVSKSIAIDHSLLRADIYSGDGAGRAGEFPLLGGKTRFGENFAALYFSPFISD